jgi:hypothetical protein
MTPEQEAQCRADGLKPFTVIFYEGNPPSGSYRFPCWAEDRDHAIEQTRDAYPDIEVIDVIDEDLK